MRPNALRRWIRYEDRREWARRRRDLAPTVQEWDDEGVATSVCRTRGLLGLYCRLGARRWDLTYCESGVWSEAATIYGGFWTLSGDWIEDGSGVTRPFPLERCRNRPLKVFRGA